MVNCEKAKSGSGCLYRALRWYEHALAGLHAGEAQTLVRAHTDLDTGVPESKSWALLTSRVTAYTVLGSISRVTVKAMALAVRYRTFDSLSAVAAERACRSRLRWW